MKDGFNREINYMRISVTDRCNLRCKYCMPEEGIENLGHENILSFEDIERIVKASTQLGITKYRITGGEPLVRKGIVNLIDNISKIEGVNEIALTTNGILLKDMAEPLKKAGLNRVNISLDSMNYTKYKQITRGGNLDDAFAGINAAISAGLGPVKLNVVAIKGFNDDEIMDFVQLTLTHPIDVRFIEMMPIGQADMGEGYSYLSSADIKKKLPALRPALAGSDGVAENFMYPQARGKIGFISPMSNHFCGTCNKIRLTADGKLKPCLHTNEELPLIEILRKNDDELLKEAIKDAILKKCDRHYLNEGASPIERDMNKIGG